MAMRYEKNGTGGVHRARPIRLVDLSVIERDMLRTFVDIGREQCRHADWSVVEPELAKRWREYRWRSGLDWDQVRPLLQRVCGRKDLCGDSGLWEQ